MFIARKHAQFRPFLEEAQIVVPPFKMDDAALGARRGLGGRALQQAENCGSVQGHVSSRWTVLEYCMMEDNKPYERVTFFRIIRLNIRVIRRAFT
ncbi:hypothetical protein GCM10010911_62910 [Paenibacillus nasutitermitis]|uniref:Uncharacterized protein n=1 Tax=Paenibacillus nasutitermitis TaxID=1652958 RepID=A0A916ZGY1_9BACL|nr:hypothetical protein GCM10010911_62910 [Paenibacillus nasutitermitis]